MGDYFENLSHSKKSLIHVISEFQPDVYIKNLKAETLNFMIWSSASFELLEIYFCFASFFTIGITKTIKNFNIDSNTVILHNDNSKSFINPWSILPEMMTAMNLDILQKLYAQHSMQFWIHIGNNTGKDITENMYWHLVLRATTSQQFKVSVGIIV